MDRDLLTNLLPSERRETLRRSYYLRLGVVVTMFIIGLTAAAAVLLAPTYVFLLQSKSAKEARLAQANAALAASNSSGLAAQLSALSVQTATLAALAQAPSAVQLISGLLTLPRPGITLSSFVYAPATIRTGATITLSGVAATRNTLRAYQLELQNAPSVAGADLPVSAYAKDTNIDFTITVTFSS